MRLRVYAMLAVALSMPHPPAASAEQPGVVIVTSSTVEAFEQAVRGIQQGLGPASKAVIVDLANKPLELASRLGGKDVRLLITVGNNAFESAAQSGTAPI